MKDIIKKLNKAEAKKVHMQLASPELIRAWSHGEVKKPETINYRTLKPEQDGLFCAKIFGPTKKFECLCGKYKRIKFRGQVCEKCGVEVTDTHVRRERMGSVELASPVAHIWFLRSSNISISVFLDLTQKEVEKVLYFDNHIVTDPGMIGELELGQILLEESYHELLEKYGNEFEAGMGAEAIKQVIIATDIDAAIEKIQTEMGETKSKIRIKKLVKRLKMMQAFRRSNTKPEWMILDVLPVLPPALRPLIPLEGGSRFASADLNDLYRRVINRNNRLRRLLSVQAPDIIVRNEKRMLQEAVDSLYENTRHGRPALGKNKRPFRSLADMIKGKQGRFRQHLLGKRVDYSGRSVIVVGPTLKLHQCGLPKKMALELFKPFVYNRLMLPDDSSFLTLKAARKAVEDEVPEVWDALAYVISQHPVLLNRAPTLHRLGIQAFEPLLVEGKAIQLHPLVCAAFNADFDGDQMAVHIPLSIEAQLEARTLMMSSNNILSPANGEPIIVPSQDVVLGLYYMTREKINDLGEGGIFADINEVHRAYSTKQLGLHARIKVRITEYTVDKEGNKTPRSLVVDTVTGRVLLFEIVPDGLEFALVNQTMDKKKISQLINVCYRRLGQKETVVFADQLMYTGFDFSTQSGASIAVSDFIIPENKTEIIEQSTKEVQSIDEQYNKGFVSGDERLLKIIDVWSRATTDISETMMSGMEYEEVRDKDNKLVKQSSFNSVFMYADSGARGSQEQIRQLAGMRGLMYKPDGSIIDTPITANFREGLSVLQYFISTHGARKGLTDTALKTSSAGYLTRRLVDAAQDVVITEEDCTTTDGMTISGIIQGDEVIVPLHERILGRVTAEDVVLPLSESVIPRNTLIEEEQALQIEEEGVFEVKVRSVIFCKTHPGVCSKCYGRDLARGCYVHQGETVGVIAAQSIGEPGTQLTMRTFHTGGAASRTSGEDRVEVKHDGIVTFHNIRTLERSDGTMVVSSREGELHIFNVEHNRKLEQYKIPYGAELSIKDNDKVSAGTLIAQWDPHANPIIAEIDGTVNFENMQEGTTVQHQLDTLTGTTTIMVIPVSERPAFSSQSKERLQPAISLVDKKGKTLLLPGTGVAARYLLGDGSTVIPEDKAQVNVGDVLARTPRDDSNDGDITGGLPRVADLFEARTPKEAAILAEIDGIISLDNKEIRNKNRLKIYTEEGGEHVDIAIPKDRTLHVHEGERVHTGQVLVEGPYNPHDLIRLRGVHALTEYLVDQIQSVYRLQGVKINDKHIEVIIKQMLRKVEVLDGGDSEYIVGEQVSYSKVVEANKQLAKDEKAEVKFQPILMGITRSSIANDSVLAAASFQETTRVVTEAAISAKVDKLSGLKENIVIGRLIPAGTGRRKAGLDSDQELANLFDEGQQDDEASNVDDEAPVEATETQEVDGEGVTTEQPPT